MHLTPIALPQGGKIMLFVGVLDAANAQQRYQGLKEALAGSNVQIIDVRTDNTDRVRAKSNAADTLVNQPDIAGLVGVQLQGRRFDTQHRRTEDGDDLQSRPRTDVPDAHRHRRSLPPHESPGLRRDDFHRRSVKGRA